MPVHDEPPMICLTVGLGGPSCAAGADEEPGLPSVPSLVLLFFLPLLPLLGVSLVALVKTMKSPSAGCAVTLADDEPPLLSLPFFTIFATALSGTWQAGWYELRRPRGCRVFFLGVAVWSRMSRMSRVKFCRPLVSEICRKYGVGSRRRRRR